MRSEVPVKRIRAAIVALLFSAALLYRNAEDLERIVRRRPSRSRTSSKTVPNNPKNEQPKTAKTVNFKRKNSTTVIVMFDNRALDDVNLTDPRIYWRWAADLNHHYAQQHGYDFFYLQSTVAVQQHQQEQSDEETKSLSDTKTRTTCYLEVPHSNVTVPRGAPWCKLLGIASMLERGYSTIIHIDSDAYFKLGSPNITTIIQENTNTSSKDNGQEQFPLVWFLNDSPWNPNAPNSGFQIWNNTNKNHPAAWRFLRQWWQTNTCAQNHPFEQQAIMDLCRGQQQQQTDTKKQYQIGLLTMNSMVKHNWKNPALPVVHITSIKKGSREKVMRPEWQKIVNTTNGDSNNNNNNNNERLTLEQVISVSFNETFRLQRLLQVEVDETFADIVAHREKKKNQNQGPP